MVTIAATVSLPNQRIRDTRAVVVRHNELDVRTLAYELHEIVGVVAMILRVFRVGHQVIRRAVIVPFTISRVSTDVEVTGVKCYVLDGDGSAFVHLQADVIYAIFCETGERRRNIRSRTPCNSTSVSNGCLLYLQYRMTSRANKERNSVSAVIFLMYHIRGKRLCLDIVAV